MEGENSVEDKDGDALASSSPVLRQRKIISSAKETFENGEIQQHPRLICLPLLSRWVMHDFQRVLLTSLDIRNHTVSSCH